MSPKFVLDPKKLTENDEGELTPYGMRVLHRYAKKWVKGNVRDLELERVHEELEGPFQDIRQDPEYANYHALPMDK